MKMRIFRLALGVVFGVWLMAQAAPALAGGVSVEHFRLKVWGVNGYAVILVARDFWGKAIAWRMVPTPNGEADLPWDSRMCNGPCRVEIERELTEAQFNAISQELRLQQIENQLSVPRTGR